MRVVKAHILDDRDAVIDDVARAVAEVRSPVNHRQRDKSAMPEENDGGHREAPVQFARDGRKIGAQPTFTPQLDCQKNKGFDQAGRHLAVGPRVESGRAPARVSRRSSTEK